MFMVVYSYSYSSCGVPVLKFDGVYGVVLSRSDSFNGNGLSYGKLFWRSENLLFSDGAASRSGEEVICLASFLVAATAVPEERDSRWFVR